MFSEALDEITYPFNGCIVEVWEWRSNFIQQFILNVITFPTWVKVNTCW